VANGLVRPEQEGLQPLRRARPGVDARLRAPGEQKPQAGQKGGQEETTSRGHVRLFIGPAIGKL
jgi:hypothetical protein